MEALFSVFQGIFVRLLDYSLDVSILICLIFLIRFTIRKKLPAWWNYGLWVILIFRMLIPFGPENIFIFSNIVPSFSDSVLFELPAVNMNDSGGIGDSGFFIEYGLILLWLTGIFSFGIYIFIKNHRFRMIIKSQPFLTDKKVIDLLEECKIRMDMNTVPGVIITDRIKSPALFGYLRPMLLLPEGTIEKLNDIELAYVFMHELGHLKRHDIAISWILSIIQVLNWFNPFVWIAFHNMRVDLESACDASVLARISRRQSLDYGKTIISFLDKFCRNRQLPALAGIMESRSQIKSRIIMIKNYKKLSRKGAIAAASFLVFIGLLAFSFSGFANIRQKQAEKIYSIQDIDTAPKIVRMIYPLYPAQAKMLGISGRVMIRLIITSTGEVKDPEIVESSSEGIFDESAVSAVKKYVFTPGQKNGKAVDCIARMPIAFNID